MEVQNIEYLSGEVREVLSKPPSSATKWVLYISLGMLALLTIAGFTFQFPEIIYGELVLSTAEAPYYVDSPRTGTLAEVKVKEGQLVKKNQLIALFENDADVDDIIELENDLNKLRTLDESEIRIFTPNKDLVLGQHLGVIYQDFISALEFVPLADGDQTNQDAIYSIHIENEQLERSNNDLENAVVSADREKSSVEKSERVYRDTKMKEPGNKAAVANDLFKFDERKKSLDTQMANLKSAINKNIEKIKANNSKILQMRSNQQAGIQDRIIDLNKSISKLRTAIADWKSNNLIYAPASGSVSFFANMELKKRYKKDEELIAIIPEMENTEYIGIVNIPIEGSGKVKEGQEVNLKFSRYPFIEFGVVKGTVKKIYRLAKGNTYSVEVDVSNGLETTHGKTLGYYQQMEGTAEIITEDRLFIGRLFEKVLSIWRA